MIWNPAQTSRRAYASMAVILTMGILALLLMALARYAEGQRVNERNADLAARADLLLISARDWSAIHADGLRATGEKELPLDGLLPETCSGTLVLKFVQVRPGHDAIECRLVLRDGSYAVTRHASWPAAAS